MPVGIIINSVATLSGGIIGALASKIIPLRLKNNLPMIFGFSAMALGISKIIEVTNITVVILSLIIGFIIGEILNIEAFFLKLVNSSIRKMVKTPPEDSASLDIIVMAIMIFCFSGTGIFGALKEGLNQDSTILLSKSSMDFFTAIIFASLSGVAIALISIPQFLVMLSLYSIAILADLQISEYVLGNFAAVGGIITMIVGFKMTNMTKVSVANVLPALVVVLIISKL